MKRLCCIICICSCVNLGAAAQTPIKVKKQKVTMAAGSPAKAPASAPQGKDVALVAAGKGTATSGKKTYLLAPPKRVLAGWVLACDVGTLVIRYDNGDKVTLTPGMTHTVRYIPRKSGPNDSMIVSGGLKMGPDAHLYSPPPDPGRVWPAHFVARWTPLPKGTKIVLTLRDRPPVLPDDPPLWSKEWVEDGQGACVDTALQQLLQQIQTSSPNAKLQFTLQATLTLPEASQSHTVAMKLLTQAEEKRLNQELSRSDKETIPFLLHTARSSAFLHAALYTEAAEEIEQALALYPDSVDLKMAAIWAYLRTGNFAREEALKNSLPPGTKIPDN